MKLVWLTGALALISATAHAGETRTITFAEAVELASSRAADVLIAKQGVVAAEEHAASTRGNLLPRLSADGNVLVWSEAQEIALGGPPGTMTSTIPVPTLKVRNQVTASLTLTVAEPLTGLYAITKLMSMDSRAIEAARADQIKAQLDAGNRAGEAFIRILQAHALKEITEKSLAQVEAQLERAQSLEKAGVLQTVDVLRLESARQQTKQALLRAGSGTLIATRGLALALNQRDGTIFEPKDDLPVEPPAITVQSAEAITAAITDRPELIAAQKRVEIAGYGRLLAMAAWIPDITAIATYQRNEGSAFQQKNALFAGVNMRWNVWDWGRTWNAADEADARAEQARLGAEALADAIAFDAERRVLDARTAYETIAVSKAGLNAAEEAQRIQSSRYAQGAATTTDVLDAETDLARARSGFANARYEYYLSLIALSRAVGDMPKLGGGNQ